MTSRRLIAVSALAMSTVACGGKSPGAPTPTPTPTPPPPAATAALTGRVTAPDGVPVVNAHVEIAAGVNAGQNTTTAGDGTYRFSALQYGTFTLRASAAGSL